MLRLLGVCARLLPQGESRVTFKGARGYRVVHEESRARLWCDGVSACSLTVPIVCLLSAVTANDGICRDTPWVNAWIGSFFFFFVFSS